MKPRNKNSIDGFVSRRGASAARVGSDDQSLPLQFTNAARRGAYETEPQQLTSFYSRPGRQDIDEALRAIGDDVPADEPTSRKARKARKVKKVASKRHFRPRKKVVLWIIGIIIGAVLVIAGLLAIKAYLVSNKIFNGGSLLSLIAPGTPLKTDSQGRTNILLFGTSQDDAAHQDASGGGGLWLTDSIELISIDQKTKTVKMVGIPRDLWVSLGDNCSIGNYGKINAVYECGSGLWSSSGTPGPNYKQQDEQGAQALMSTVQSVTGITPQYYVHADYTVLQQAVNAVGGIDVDIVGDGADGIYDTNFDWDCPNGPYTCKNVYYPHDGVYHLDGTQALFLARARADAGSYSYKDFGLAQGDFDRQANQQKIIVALKAKAESAGTLANPVALNGLLDALGNNITMDFSGGEIKTLLDFTKSIGNNAMQSVSLVSQQSPVVTTGEADGQSVVEPTSGLYDYSSIVNYLAQQLSTNPAVAEGATIGVYNASGTPGEAGNLQSSLQKTGLNVDNVGDAAASDAGTGKYTLYDMSNGKKPKTLAALEKTLGVKPTAGAVPSDITASDDFVIVINQ